MPCKKGTRKNIDDGKRRAVAGTAEVLRVARVVAAHDDTEALEDPRGESSEAVVPARRQRESVALADAKRVAGKLLRVEDMIVTVVGKPDGMPATPKRAPGG